MINIGITGQSGFIGNYLYNTLGLYPEKYKRVGFKNEYFDDIQKLCVFVSQCDVIVHLAALNRHQGPGILYDTNIKLVKKIIEACETSNSTPHIIFSSSTQEAKDNLYGKSKKEGRALFEKWAEKNSGVFSGFIIPNVFGPFGKPYYNSVVATFCHQLTQNEPAKIEVDNEVGLIYVAEIVDKFLERIENCSTKKNLQKCLETIVVVPTKIIFVSELLSILEEYQSLYFKQGIIPCLDQTFEKNLFNTFLSYINYDSFFPFPLKINSDERGCFVELIKLHSGGQISFSSTKQGITRGNHFHTRKSERFAVIKGKARIDIRRIGTSKVYSFELDGVQPSFVDMPIWYTHNITNTGEMELLTLFWINEHFNPDDTDTFFEKVN